jgi:nucleotide-binding universal stress UspA family protein
MPLKNILVALDGSPASDVALQGAVAMRDAYGAHLTGLVSVAESMGLAEAGNRWIPSAIAKTIEKATGEAMHAVESRFAEATAGCPADRIHIIERARGNDTTIAEASRFFDIAVVGIPEQGSKATRLHPDRIALLSGRPVLAFPAGIKAPHVAKRAVVAWNGSRTAARAMNSAMRLLDSKETIVVVTVGPAAPGQADPSGLDPETALRRQDLDARWVHVPIGPGGIAATLLAQAKAHEAELLVMGAYENSKFREDLFGGVTHEVMAKTTIPVFLAH